MQVLRLRLPQKNAANSAQDDRSPLGMTDRYDASFGGRTLGRAGEAARHWVELRARRALLFFAFEVSDGANDMPLQFDERRVVLGQVRGLLQFEKSAAENFFDAARRRVGHIGDSPEGWMQGSGGVVGLEEGHAARSETKPHANGTRDLQPPMTLCILARSSVGWTGLASNSNS